MYELSNKEYLDILVNGATLLASGGGGSRKSSELVAGKINEKLKSRNTNVSDVLESQVENNKQYAVVGGIGSPDALENSGVIDDVIISINTAMEEMKEIDFGVDILLSVETGTNMFIAMLAAILSGKKVFDGDGAGRAVPTLSCLTYSKQSIAPFILSHKNEESCAIVNSKNYKCNSKVIEEMVRPIISTKYLFNNIAGFSCWPIKGSDLKNCIIKNTFARAYGVGRVIRDEVHKLNKQGKPFNITKIINALNNEKKINIKVYNLMPNHGYGTLLSDSEATSGGFDRGVLIFEEQGHSDRKVTIVNQNENIIAWDNNKSQPLAMAPDLICYMDEQGNAQTNADINVGAQLYLLGIKVDDALRQDYLKAAFMNLLNSAGYFGNYVSIKELHR